jgi:hypothetical protein
MSNVGPTGPLGKSGRMGLEGPTGPAGPAGSAASLINGTNVIGATGTFSNVGTEQNTIFGVDVNVSGTGTVSIGYGVTSSNSNSVAIGQYSKSSADNSIAMGQQSWSSGANSVNIGYGYRLSGPDNVLIGSISDSVSPISFNTENSIIIGKKIAAVGFGGNINIGTNTTTAASNSCAIGNNASASDNSYAIGNGAISSQPYAMAIGMGATSDVANQVVLGNLYSTVKPGGNLVLSSASADPGSPGTYTTPVPGMIYFNTGTKKLKFYNGTAWETITSA